MQNIVQFCATSARKEIDLSSTDFKIEVPTSLLCKFREKVSHVVMLIRFPITDFKFELLSIEPNNLEHQVSTYLEVPDKAVRGKNNSVNICQSQSFENEFLSVPRHVLKKSVPYDYARTPADWYKRDE